MRDASVVSKFFSKSAWPSGDKLGAVAEKQRPAAVARSKVPGSGVHEQATDGPSRRLMGVMGIDVAARRADAGV